MLICPFRFHFVVFSIIPVVDAPIPDGKIRRIDITHIINFHRCSLESTAAKRFYSAGKIHFQHSCIIKCTVSNCFKFRILWNIYLFKRSTSIECLFPNNCYAVRNCNACNVCLLKSTIPDCFKFRILWNIYLRKRSTSVKCLFPDNCYAVRNCNACNVCLLKSTIPDFCNAVPDFKCFQFGTST